MMTRPHRRPGYRHGRRCRRGLAAILAIVILAATACSTADPDRSAIGDDPADTDTSSADSSVSGAPEREALVLSSPDWAGLDRWHLSAIGGITFGVRPEYVVHHDNHMITIRDRFENDRGRSLPTMVIAQVNTSFITPISELDDFLDPSGLGESGPNGLTLDMFDRSLDGYTFTGDPGRSDPIYMYPAYGPGYRGQSAWQPFPFAELFVTEIPGGVVVVGYVWSTDSERSEAEEIFHTVAPTVELDRPLPTEAADRLPPIVATDYRGAPAPLTLPDSGPPILTQAFAPIDPGTYRTAHLGTPARFTVGDGWWVQGNFPGELVLSAIDAFGPGDRGILLQVGKTELVPATIGPEVAGPPIDFTDLETFASDPPRNLVVGDPQIVQLGDHRAARIDITVDPTAACTAADPCQYIWPADLPYPAQELRIGYTTRVWRVLDLEPVVTIIAQSPDPGWLVRADDVIATLEFG